MRAINFVLFVTLSELIVALKRYRIRARVPREEASIPVQDFPTLRERSIRWWAGGGGHQRQSVRCGRRGLSDRSRDPVDSTGTRSTSGAVQSPGGTGRAPSDRGKILTRRRKVSVWVEVGCSRPGSGLEQPVRLVTRSGQFKVGSIIDSTSGLINHKLSLLWTVTASVLLPVMFSASTR